MKKGLKIGETGSLGSTKPSSPTTSPTTEESKKTLEQEAKEFKTTKQKKRPPVKPKPMTSRIYLAGQAMNALLSRSQGLVRLEDVKRESFEIADFMSIDED